VVASRRGIIKERKESERKVIVSKTAHNRKSRKIIIAQRAEAREHFES